MAKLGEVKMLGHYGALSNGHRHQLKKQLKLGPDCRNVECKFRKLIGLPFHSHRVALLLECPDLSKLVVETLPT